MYLTITLCAQLEPDIASKRYHAVWARTFLLHVGLLWPWSLTQKDSCNVISNYLTKHTQWMKHGQDWAEWNYSSGKMWNGLIENLAWRLIFCSYFARTVLYAYCLFTYLELEVSLCISQHVTFLDILTVVCRIF